MLATFFIFSPQSVRQRRWNRFRNFLNGVRSFFSGPFYTHQKNDKFFGAFWVIILPSRIGVEYICRLSVRVDGVEIVEHGAKIEIAVLTGLEFLDCHAEVVFSPVFPKVSPEFGLNAG